MYAYIAINIIGLILDLIGFIGIYYIKLKKVEIERSYRPYYKSQQISDADLKSVSENIMNSVSDSLKELNRSYVERDRKTLKYFVFVIIGVLLQIISIIVYFCQNQF